MTIAVTLVMGLVLGAWNGWWVAYRKVPSFIVTLAGMLAFRGILIGITNGTTVSPTSPAMSQIGQSYLPDGLGFGIGVIGMVAFIVWQWRGRLRRQSLGLTTPRANLDGGTPEHYCGYRARRHLAIKRLSRRPHAGSHPGSSAAGGNVYGHPNSLWPANLCHWR